MTMGGFPLLWEAAAQIRPNSRRTANTAAMMPTTTMTCDAEMIAAS